MNIPKGSNISPGLTFEDNPTTGMYMSDASEIAFSITTSPKLAIGRDAVTSNVALRATSGTVSKPSITFATAQKLGLYKVSNSVIGVTAGGSKVLELRPSTEDEAIVGTDVSTVMTPHATKASILDTLKARGGFVSPIAYGAPDNGIDPASDAIQAAVDAVASGEVSGIVWLDRKYALDKPVSIPKGVTVWGNGSFNRRAFPNEFNGVHLYPHADFPSGRALFEIGETGSMDTNPNGAYFQGLVFDGRYNTGSHMTNAIGVYVSDTSDVRFFNCYFGGFDRTTTTGFCLIVEGSGEGNCFGTTVSHCVFSNSQHGILYTGLGATDMRHDNNLFVGITRALSLGYDDRGGTVKQQGGAGCQIVNDHYTYTGMPTAGWFIRTGSQGGTLMVSNAYFDQVGTGTPVRLGNAKARFNNCHFLCAVAQNVEGLIRVQTAGTQETLVTNCSVDLLGSNLQAIIWYSAKAGSPTSGGAANNIVTGTGPSWKGFMIDQAGTVIAESSGGSSYVNMGNMRQA